MRPNGPWWGKHRPHQRPDAGDSLYTPISTLNYIWDENPFLLGVENGCLDLRTGELGIAKPSDYITLQCATRWEPDAVAPTFRKTVAEVFAGMPPGFLDYFQRALGYTITGDCREEVFFIAHGSGRNGKGTILNTVADILGTYATVLNAATLAETPLSQRDGPTPGLAKLPGKRLIAVSEWGDKQKLDAARFKSLSGRDPITCRQLYGCEFTFKLQGKIWVQMNPEPQIDDQSDAIYARLHMLHFLNSFVGKEDLLLKDKLMKEYRGILVWLVEGCRQWLRHWLARPAVVLDATNALRKNNDRLAVFYEMMCIVEEGAEVSGAALYECYKRWHYQSRQKDNPLTQAAFGRLVAERFPRHRASGGKAFYNGIKLNVAM